MSPSVEPPFSAQPARTTTPTRRTNALRLMIPPPTSDGGECRPREGRLSRPACPRLHPTGTSTPQQGENRVLVFTAPPRISCSTRGPALTAETYPAVLCSLGGSSLGWYLFTRCQRRLQSLRGGRMRLLGDGQPETGLVLVAGARLLNDDGAVIAMGDVAARARQVMPNFRAELRDAGSELKNVARTPVFVASSDRADLVTAWDAVREAKRRNPRPAPCSASPPSITRTSWSRWRRSPSPRCYDSTRTTHTTHTTSTTACCWRLPAEAGRPDRARRLPGQRRRERRLDRLSANAPVAVLVHCCGMARRWSSNVNLRVPVARDRETEFAARHAYRSRPAPGVLHKDAFVSDVRAPRFDAYPGGRPARTSGPAPAAGCCCMPWRRSGSPSGALRKSPDEG